MGVLTNADHFIVSLVQPVKLQCASLTDTGNKLIWILSSSLCPFHIDVKAALLDKTQTTLYRFLIFNSNRTIVTYIHSIFRKQKETKFVVCFRGQLRFNQNCFVSNFHS